MNMMNMEKESIKERMVLHEWINERIMNTMKMNEHDQGLFHDFFFCVWGGGIWSVLGTWPRCDSGPFGLPPRWDSTKEYRKSL